VTLKYELQSDRGSRWPAIVLKRAIVTRNQQSSRENAPLLDLGSPTTLAVVSWGAAIACRGSHSKDGADADEVDGFHDQNVAEGSETIAR